MVSTQTTDKCHRCKTHVPLTEEEIIDLWAGVSDPESPDISMIDFARAIERAHGIGGNDE